jgi:catechol 2,3-dioxygenase-like lactoylglutathione lyase family enzyme
VVRLPARHAPDVRHIRLRAGAPSRAAASARRRSGETPHRRDAEAKAGTARAPPASSLRIGSCKECAVKLATLCLALACAGAAQEPVRHPFLCTDNGHHKVFAVDAGGAITWEYAAFQPQDVWRLPNGHILLSHQGGVREVTFDAAKQVVWQYQAPAGSEVHGCQPLPGGGAFLVECGTKRLVELDAKGQPVKTIPIESSLQNAHAQFRVARKLASGNYLVAYLGERQIRELGPDGKAVRTIKVPGDPFVALRLPNGNTLIGCGDGHKVLEVDPADKVVWQLDEHELPGNPLRFVAGLQRLPNGNTVVCNWGGHGHLGKQPQVFEVTRDKRVVWQVFDNKLFRTISNIALLDQPGDPLKGDWLR